MSKIDQFESVFKSAAKERFAYQKVNIKSVLILTDLDDYHTRLYADQIRRYLAALGDEVEWTDMDGSKFNSVPELLGLVEETRPDLIVSYRNLGAEAQRWPFSLGVHIDVLTQVADTPVLLTPNPVADESLGSNIPDNTNEVMVVTDRITGSDDLINFGVSLTAPNGKLFLTHIEDDKVFDRYMDVISKLPSIATTPARDSIHGQLLKEPADFIESCREVLQQEGLPIEIKPIVIMGHLVSDYKRLLVEHEVDLLVFNTKDEDQMAMHGVAYPLAVELRNIPLLML